MPPYISPTTGLIRFAICKQTPTVKLFRDVCKEIPRISTIFDLDIPTPVIRSRIAKLIRKNAHVKDERVVKALVSKGYLDLEEACLQYKTRHQLLNLIDPTSMRKHAEVSDEEKFIRGY